MEKDLDIQIGKKFIYGKLRGKLKDKLIIFVHGYRETRDEHIFYNGARYFEMKGMPTYRFNLYGYHEDEDRIGEIGFSDYSEKLKNIIQCFTDAGVKSIALVGHSFGGIAILNLRDIKYSASIFWETSFAPFQNIDDDLKQALFDRKTKQYLYLKTGILIPKKFVEEGRKLKGNRLVKSIKSSTLFVYGSNTVLKNASAAMMFKNSGANKKELRLIKGAGHNFHENDTALELFEVTYKFLKKIKF